MPFSKTLLVLAASSVLATAANDQYGPSVLSAPTSGKERSSNLPVNASVTASFSRINETSANVSSGPPFLFSSGLPSLEPSIVPASSNDVPSQAPIAYASRFPSSKPSNIPSVQVSHLPSSSKSPSSSPSQAPSKVKSNQPSYSPLPVPKIPSDIPSQAPTVYESNLPSSRPSNGPSVETSHSPSSSTSPSSSPSQTPSTAKSTHPSYSPSPMPSVLPSDQPTIMLSMSPSEIPTQKPSKSNAPSAYTDSLTNVTFAISLDAKNSMNATDIVLFQSITKEFLISDDEFLDIYSVTVFTQDYEGRNSRRLSLIRGPSAQEDIGTLKVSGYVLGKGGFSLMSSVVLERVVFRSRINSSLTSELLPDQLAMSMSIFRPNSDNDSEVATIRNGDEVKTGANANANALFAKIGAGLGIAGIIVMAALFLGKKFPKNANLSRLSNHYVVDDHGEIDDGILIVEADAEIGSTRSSKRGSYASTNTFGEKDRFSTLSYSDTSSEFVHGQDFLMSLTSSSIASNTLTTISEGKHDHILPAPTSNHQMANWPVQKLVRPVPIVDSNCVRKASKSADRSQNDRSKDSNSYSDVIPQKTGIRRMFACGGDLAQSLSGIISDNTPRVSNVLDSRLDPDSSSISVVSSLSGQSSYSGAASNLSGGETFEVLVPASKPLGLVVKSSRSGPKVLKVKDVSPLGHWVKPGDYILSADGMDARRMTARELSQWLHRNDGRMRERTLILMRKKKSYVIREDDDSDIV